MDEAYGGKTTGRAYKDEKSVIYNNKYKKIQEDLMTDANNILTSIGFPHIARMSFKKMEEELNKTKTLEILKLIENEFGFNKPKKLEPLKTKQNTKPLRERTMTLSDLPQQSTEKMSSKKQVV